MYGIHHIKARLLNNDGYLINNKSSNVILSPANDTENENVKWPNLLTIQLPSYLCQVSKLREPSARLHTKCKYGDQGRKSVHNIPEPLFKRFFAGEMARFT